MQTLPPTPHSSSRDRPSTKRSSPACEQQPKRSKIFLWRAGSVESECTRLDMSTSPAAAAPEAAGDGGGGKEGGWDSAESQSVLQAPNVLGSGASDAEISGLAAPPQPQATLGAAAHVAGEGAAAAPGSQPDEELVQAPRQLVSPEFLAELAAANACLQHLPLPGGVHFSPVHPSCVLLPLFESYEMPPAAVALGASYFQRLLAGCEGLAEEAVAAGFFSWHPAPSGKLEPMMHARAGNDSLLSILCTCVYLGLKMCEGPKYSFLLSNMLTAINRTHIPSEEATAFEMKCLKRLGWRLGPYCCLPCRA